MLNKRFTLRNKKGWIRVKILTDYKELVGKKIAFSHMAEFAEQITLATEDGCVLMVNMEYYDEDDVRIKVLYPHLVLRVLHGHEWMRNELGTLGIFDVEKYKEEQRIEQERKQEEFRKKQAEKEREEYKRLKAKFENA